MEDPAYGGSCAVPVDPVEGWIIPGEVAVLLHPLPSERARKGEQ